MMDSERGYLELGLLYMERCFKKYQIIWRYLQLVDDIFKNLKLSLIHLRNLRKIKISFNYIKIPSNIEYMLKRFSIYNKLNS